MTDARPLEPDLPIASVRLTAEEVAALASADLDFFPPGVEPLADPDDEKADASDAGRESEMVEAGWRSLIARELVDADGTFSQLLLSMRAVFLTARLGVVAHDFTSAGTWQRTLYIGEAVGLAHGVGPEGLHTFLAVAPDDWADGMRTLVVSDIELAAPADADVATSLEERADELTRVLKIFGFRDSDDVRTSTAFDIVVTKFPWLIDADRTTLIPLTKQALEDVLAPLSDGDGNATAPIHEETTT